MGEDGGGQLTQQADGLLDGGQGVTDPTQLAVADAEGGQRGREVGLVGGVGGGQPAVEGDGLLGGRQGPWWCRPRVA